MVNSESGSDEILMKKLTFRLTGVLSDQALLSFDTDITRKTVKDLMIEVHTEYNLNSILYIHLILNGKVLSDSTPLVKLRLKSNFLPFPFSL